MEPLIEKKLTEIRSTFKKHGAVRAYLFGSAASGKLSNHSDVDFLFSFPAEMDFETYANSYFALLNSLRQILNREVDLVAEKTLKNPYLIESINASKIQLL
jgi:predicted nucleotidyltransferase